MPSGARAPDDAELPALAALIRLAFSHQSVATDPPSSALQETAETIAAHIAAGGGALVLDGPAGAGLSAGLLWAEEDGGLYIGRLAVHPQRRGHGLARRLIGAAERLARGRGLPRVHLSTRLPLVDNRRLFAACGFRETEITTHPGYAAPTSVTMEKYL